MGGWVGGVKGGVKRGMKGGVDRGANGIGDQWKGLVITTTRVNILLRFTILLQNQRNGIAIASTLVNILLLITLLLPIQWKDSSSLLHYSLYYFYTNILLYYYQTLLYSFRTSGRSRHLPSRGVGGGSYFTNYTTTTILHYYYFGTSGRSRHLPS